MWPPGVRTIEIGERPIVNGIESGTPSSARSPAGARWRALTRPAGLVTSVLLCTFLVVLMLGRTYPSDAALFPTLVGASGVVLSLVYLGALAFGDADGVDREPVGTDRRSFLIALLASPVYSVAVYIAGFHAATFFAMLVMPLLLGFRHPLRLVLIALASVAILHLIFAVAMQIDLPVGLIGDFYLRHFVYQD